MYKDYKPSIPEVRIYPIRKWRNLTSEPNNGDHKKKAEYGWYDGTTPSFGFKVDGHDRAVSALYVQFFEVASYVQDNVLLVTIPPPHNVPPTLPPEITNDTSTAGQSFGRRGTRQEHHSDNN